MDGYKNEGEKKHFISHIVIYALKVSVDGVKCVFVAHFRSSGTI